jgi:acetolactate decarboxylase
VKDGKVVVDTTSRPKACFLVYTQVEEWLEVAIPDSVKSDADFETSVTESAAKSGLAVNRPFAFLVKGKAKDLQCHVANKTDAAPHNHEQHEKAKVKFAVRDAAVKILGFYSDQHQGVFTCGGNLHMHVVTEDGRQSGHVDELRLSTGCKLYLPKFENR